MREGPGVRGERPGSASRFAKGREASPLPLETGRASSLGWCLFGWGVNARAGRDVVGRCIRVAEPDRAAEDVWSCGARGPEPLLIFVDPPRGRAGWVLGRIGRRSFPSPKVTGGGFEEARRPELAGRRGAGEAERAGFIRGAREGEFGPLRGPSSPFCGVWPIGFEGMCSDPNSIVERRFHSLDCDSEDLVLTTGLHAVRSGKTATAPPLNSIEICSEAV